MISGARAGLASFDAVRQRVAGDFRPYSGIEIPFREIRPGGAPCHDEESPKRLPLYPHFQLPGRPEALRFPKHLISISIQGTRKFRGQAR